MVKIHVVSQMGRSIIGDGNDTFPVSLSLNPEIWDDLPEIYIRYFQSDQLAETYR